MGPRGLRPAGLAGVLAGVLALGGASLCLPAYAAGSVQVRIRDASLKPNGSTTLVVQASGAAVQSTLTQANFSVQEDGKAVQPLTVKPLFAAGTQPQQVSVAVLIDDSGSTIGKPHADAIGAATAFINALPSSVQVAIFGFAATVSQASGFTSDHTQLTAALQGLSAGGETAIFDAVTAAAAALGAQPGQHDIVLFTDGGDTVSKATLNSAVAAAQAVKAQINVVGLQTPDYKPAVLATLSSQTGGTVTSVSDSGHLASAFATIEQSIASQYLVSYTSTATQPSELNLTVAVNAGSSSGSDTITVVNTRVAPSPSAAPSPTSPPLAALPRAVVPALGSSTGLYVGILAAFAALALLLIMLLYRPDTSAGRLLQRSVELTVRPGSPGSAPAREAGTLATSITQRATEFVGTLPKPEGFEEKLQGRLDRAAWKMRSTEFLTIQFVVGILGLVVGWGLFSNFLLGLLFALVGFAIPSVLLTRAVAKRSADFLAQLPDTLQLLSASLRAGYGLLQAIDTVTKESSPPASVEFSRVLAEARLGRPIEEALDAMAERVGGEDFRWVVMAINIQRQVGGNLATILETVANTLRERAGVRRQVRVLSAEGRLSAYVLFFLPIAMALYLFLFKRSYFLTLFSSWVGDAAVVFAGILMSVGALWIRKIIRIEI